MLGINQILNVAPVSGSVRKIIIVLVATLAVGCVTTTSSVKQIDRLDAVGENPRILVMPPDVKYLMLTAGGVIEPHAQWTEAARQNFSDALQAYATERGIKIIRLEADRPLSDREVSYQKLHEAVGNAILIHHFGTWPLPTKQGSLDWSLGPGVREIAKEYGADYALFTFYRDIEASSGRSVLAGLAFAASLLTGSVGRVSTGGEGGFASLVDLRSGDVVWFNQVAAGAGELRQNEGAREAVDLLFKNLPES